MSVVGMHIAPAVPQRPTIDSLDGLTASAVGARPLLPSPALGTPTVRNQPIAKPAAELVDEYSEEPVPGISQTFKNFPPPVAAGLARTSGVHPSTTIGVPPPPAAPITRPQPAVAPPRVDPRRSENRLWLVVGAILVVAATVALVLVLAR
jgi:hypothetical protein